MKDHCNANDPNRFESIGGPLTEREDINDVEACAMASKKITCEVRCLEPGTLRAAKQEMKGAVIGKVPFVCKLSGKTENILLLSNYGAQRLASVPDKIGGPLTQKTVYAILGAELCECDIATLTEGEDGQVLDELDRLRSAGIVKCREIEGMTYYALANADVEDVLTRRLSELDAR